MGRLQCIALASPSEVAWGRIISFLLMSSTSWRGGEAITLLLFPPLLLAATTAASLRVTYVYCIRVEWHNIQPSARSLARFLYLSRHCIWLVFGSIRKDRCHVAKAFSEMSLFFFTSNPLKSIKIEAYLPLLWSVWLNSYPCLQQNLYATATQKILLIINPGGFFFQCEITFCLKRTLPTPMGLNVRSSRQAYLPFSKLDVCGSVQEESDEWNISLFIWLVQTLELVKDLEKIASRRLILSIHTR